MKSEGMKLKASLKQLQTTHAAEQAKTKELTQEVEKTSKAMEQAQDRVMSLEERRKGEMMKRNGRINVEEAHKTWGKGFKQAIDRIFF